MFYLSDNAEDELQVLETVALPEGNLAERWRLYIAGPTTFLDVTVGGGRPDIVEVGRMLGQTRQLYRIFWCTPPAAVDTNLEEAYRRALIWICRMMSTKYNYGSG